MNLLIEKFVTGAMLTLIAAILFWMGQYIVSIPPALGGVILLGLTLHNLVFWRKS